jgi:hypothetical protein
MPSSVVIAVLTVPAENAVSPVPGGKTVMAEIPEVIRITEQEALNAEAGWRPISTEPGRRTLSGLFLVTDDPTDPARAHFVTNAPGGKHYNGDSVLEDYGIVPTHWTPVRAPVAKKSVA